MRSEDDYTDGNEEATIWDRFDWPHVDIAIWHEAQGWVIRSAKEFGVKLTSLLFANTHICLWFRSVCLKAWLRIMITRPWHAGRKGGCTISIMTRLSDITPCRSCGEGSRLYF
ncbi:hypothetical protein G7K_6277-t1 [Saitoella complicata NRRL Y-17804]|uniref:Uncharacterized protein n=1 Tax=Saitoella complicata (strain BCRC 22490 / CBS 7301 / JCM 7358 / NBRC 10748 / NRRL Y-17804) TaxID=698492 RepID=A0A0E9NQR8_SAICN|nr:hypothetical protein G7K_6277-t1 [Saitoella complicata NRRL Y-17804]